MRAQPGGVGATRIRILADGHPGRVVMHSLVGSSWVVDMLVGEQLPRIC
jgi:hydrogenase expression/formation protein HypE